MTWRKRQVVEHMWKVASNNPNHDTNWHDPVVERFAELVREDERNRTWTQDHWTEYERRIAAVEREACAKVCADLWCKEPEPGDARDCYDAIRARGNKHD